LCMNEQNGQKSAQMFLFHGGLQNRSQSVSFLQNPDGLAG